MGAAESSDGFTRWYSRILRTIVHIDVKDDQFILFHRAMQNIYRLAKSHDAVAGRDESDRVSRSTRPASSVIQDRLGRTISVRQSMVGKHAKAGHLPDDRSANVRLSLSHSGATSSRASPPYDVPFPTYQGVKRDPIPPTVAQNDHQPSAHIPPPPDDGIGDPASRAQLSTLDSSKPAFALKLRQAAWPHCGGILDRFRSGTLVPRFETKQGTNHGANKCGVNAKA